MKITIKFDTEEDKEAIDCVLNHVQYSMFKEGLYDAVFRPFVKYGFTAEVTNEQLLEDIIEKYKAFYNLCFKDE